jgi:hypothetical protein
MAHSNDEIEKMIAAAAANPIGARLLETIFATDRAVELHRIYTHDIAETEGISEAEKEALREAVNMRFAVLNAAAMWPPDKPRWDAR